MCSTGHKAHVSHNHGKDTCAPVPPPAADHCEVPLRVHARGAVTRNLLFQIFEGTADVCLAVHVGTGVSGLSII